MTPLNTLGTDTLSQANVPVVVPSDTSSEREIQSAEQTLDTIKQLVDSALGSNVVDAGETAEETVELTVVMPCLNEADTIATCIEKCKKVIDEHNLSAEVVIADNGSTDGSIEIAEQLGARVVPVQAKGYGNALRGGITAARGKYVIMGDADDSYDFLEIPKFLDKLREGHQLVQGCRLPSGGGQVLPGAMPFSHRWLGNPMFSKMVRKMFKAPIHDVYCGLRGFTKDLYNDLDLRCTGMEFATEMIIKASLFRGEEIAEVPTTLHPDGRKAHARHLRTFRDGWRTLRFFLVYSPTYLFKIPGFTLLTLGLLAFALAIPGIKIFGASLDAHTMLFGTLAILMGYQLIQFSMFSRTYAVAEGLMPAEQKYAWFRNWFTLERGLIIGAGMFAAGSIMLGVAVNSWRLASFGPLDYARTMRIVIPGMTLAAVGFQTIASSFFLGVLKLGQRTDG